MPMPARTVALSALALLVACAAPQRQTWENSYQPKAGEAAAEDAFLTDADFDCMQSWTQVGRTYFKNTNGHLGETLAVARGEVQGDYPVGTVVSLFPGEAMVKRGPGYDGDTGDWEFFLIELDQGQAVITERGGAEIKNIAGTCASCHAPAAESHDWVCRDTGGCEPLPGFVIKSAAKKVAKDERCGG